MAPDRTLNSAWDQLRIHLEWTIGQPSVVLVAAANPVDRADLVERLRTQAQRRGQPIRVYAGEPDEVVAAVTADLPQEGLSVVSLPYGTKQAAARARILGRLNEVRTRLARPGQGALIVLGPSSLAAECVEYAADLWSVRSLYLVVTDALAGPAPDAPMTSTPAAEEVEGLLFARYSLPESVRSAGAGPVLSLLARASRVAGSDLGAARTLALEAARTAPEDSLEQALAFVAAAELHGAAEDDAGLTTDLRHALDVLARQPGADVIGLVDLLGDVAFRYRDLATAELARDASLRLRRELAERLGTPEALRDLSVSLNNVGTVARARGHWDTAATVYDESLTLVRELADRLGTPEALRDLSVSLDNVGAVARARGHWDTAATVYDESLTLARELADRLATPQALRDLSVSLNNVGAVAQARGHWDTAATVYDEQIGILRELADRLATPEALRDLSVSLDNVGAVAQARGHWDTAATVYDESLSLARELADRLGTPEALRDLSVSLDNVGAVARARGHWDTAATVYDESLTLARELAGRLGTPEALRDLSVSLNNVGAVARARGHWDTARTAYEEALDIARKVAALDPSEPAQQLLRWLLDHPPEPPAETTS